MELGGRYKYKVKLNIGKKVDKKEGASMELGERRVWRNGKLKELKRMKRRRNCEIRSKYKVELNKDYRKEMKDEIKERQKQIKK